MKGAPPVPDRQWHPVIQKEREQAEDPQQRREVERMGSVIASMIKKSSK
jgi:hypothetical protein